MKLPRFYQQRIDRWLDSRSPLAVQHKLTQKNLYTFPNLTGLALTVAIVILWILGTNYQNNLILGLAYLLISLFVVAIWQAFSNLVGTEIKALGVQPGFAGEDIIFLLEFRNRHSCENIQLSWPKGKKIVVDLDADVPLQIKVPCPSYHRGYLFPGRLLIESRYPLGAIRCWTHINLDMETLVYPKPIAGEEPTPGTGDEESDRSNQQRGGDDPGTLRNYQPGDSLKHIAWKLFARERGLHTKQNEQTLSSEKWLDWSSIPLPQEQRLSVLAYWALQYHSLGIAYGLMLPELKVSPETGAQHLQAVLSALAIFGLKKPAGKNFGPIKNGSAAVKNGI